MENISPLSQDQLSNLNQLIDTLQVDQLIWANAYLSGVIYRNKELVTPELSIPKENSSEKFTILYGTHTGHSKNIALDLYDQIKALGFVVNLSALDEYKKNDLKKEKNLFLIVSTHGEGEPPLQAEAFHKYLLRKRAPKLADTKYAVLALGDKSYKHFCKTGIDFDGAFENQGATRLLPLQKSDVAYEEIADQWISSIIEKLKKIKTKSSPSNGKIPNTTIRKKFSRSNPYYAEILEKTQITSTDSEKEIYHVEISLEDSGIQYEAGDSIGILPSNPVELVDLLINHFEDDPERIVRIGGKDLSLFRALQHKLEITVLNRELISAYNTFIKNETLTQLINNEEDLEKYLYGTDVKDLLEDYPGNIEMDQLLNILRVLYARLYSISSGPSANADEVHITVASVRYQNKDRDRNGACSTYLNDQINIGDYIPIYIEKNEAFRLPKTDKKTLIMVGAGTGVAPYRSFLQELEQKSEKVNSWLFFGNQHFKKDFLYQIEWQKFLQKGILAKMNVAFSRDQKEKEYVQHQLKENGKEVFQWLEKGAHFYICGDKQNMAKDVQNTLLEIIQTEGGITLEKSKEYLKDLKRKRRLLLDVY
ncbi:assimilatory sulfite reductase (NADPH) flavoprotein subunit [Ancylomarina longa]|uniref:assimilatory sulfite reductase (NADPH) n=1 Tax=Ancylomarina longa TaxID=2487017 RepID=A0A434AGE6_9BACT|nr:assimilatory sulfite reductase (NADPH) flavoprotein subunit [Ancylomarina longa]RUT73456.1 assimilatory sulfite reductase (NADPH) flavoprotein subunit [Ancylomarina longa]